MTPRLLSLAISAALLALSGCASQQTDPLAAADQRLNTLESRLRSDSNSTLVLLGELGKKVDLLSGDLRRLRESAGEQASAGAAARQALADRLAQVEKQQQAVIGENRATAARVSELQAVLSTLSEQARQAGQQIDRLAAQLDHVNTEQTLALQAETTELEARLDDAEEQLEEMASRLQDGQARTEAIETALPGLTEATAGNNQRLEALATEARSALDQAGAAQAALPGLREQAAAAGIRLNDYDARLAALNKRLDEIARMAQDAYDATGLGQRKIFGKVVESITLTEDRTLFPINSPELGEQDKAKLDALAIRLKALGTNYHLQIQGHTEGFGADDYNYTLGKARAEVVKNYLKENGGIPLLRMSVMSYGAVEAASQVGKSNRRVVVQVLQ